jgi:sec-independent protein translocase protein TatA
MLGNLTGWHLLIVLGVVVLLFGAAKLPALSKALGQSMRIFKGEMKSMKEESADAVAETSTPVTPAELPSKS